MTFCSSPPRPELPPDDVARDVTPWRRAIGNILGGSALCSITLNFFCLNYLLPTIGVILQLLGFRPLRRENRWFRACWLLAVLRAALFLPCIVLNATIYSNAVYASSVGTALTYAMLAVQMLLFFCFWQALRTMQKKAGTGGGAAPAAALLIWYAAVLALAYGQYSGLLLGLAMLGCYILILRSLFRLSREMEESGYALTPAPVRLSDEMLVRAIAALLAIGIACGYLFFGSYRMDWQPKSGSLSAEAVEIRAQLLALGYPEDALNDLSEDDLLACRGATLVVVHEADKPMNGGREVREEIGSSTHISTVYDVRELHFTDVAVRLPGEAERLARPPPLPLDGGGEIPRHGARLPLARLLSGRQLASRRRCADGPRALRRRGGECLRRALCLPYRRALHGDQLVRKDLSPGGYFRRILSALAREKPARLCRL